MIFDKSIMFSKSLVEIYVSSDFYAVAKPTYFENIPDIHSFMLTAAQGVFESFLREQIHFASQTLVQKDFLERMVKTHAFGTMRARAVMYRDIFLFNFSSMLSLILSVENYSASVLICPTCLRSFVRNVAVNKVLNHVPQITDFICNDQSLKAFDNFAKYLISKKLIKKSTSVSFAALLTYKQSNDDSFKVIDWQLLTWAWVHQVFASLSHVKTKDQNKDNIFAFIKSLVFNVFTQLWCPTCSVHSYYLNIDTSFDKIFLVYFVPRTKYYPYMWNEYGYSLHDIVNTCVLYAGTGRGYCRKIEYAEFAQINLPYLIHTSLKDFNGLRTLYSKPCLNSKIPCSKFDRTFFADEYNDASTIVMVNKYIRDLEEGIKCDEQMFSE